MFIELPKMHRFRKRVDNSSFYICAETPPELFTVSIDAIRGLQGYSLAKVGAIVGFVGDDGTPYPSRKDEDMDHRSKILLIDGKWYKIDMGYHALFALIAAHTPIIPAKPI